jgi:HD-GYP domain-containing protein (c-di-GMP phosphodiesterase class II)
MGLALMSDTQEGMVTDILKVSGSSSSLGQAGRSRDHPMDSEIMSCYQSLLKEAEAIRERIKNEQGLGEMPVLDGLRYAIQGDLVDPFYNYAMSSYGNPTDLPEHTVKVASVSLKIGKGMGYAPKKLLQLGLTAFLENIGIYRIPDHILEKSEEFDKDEITAIRGHPEKSYHILLQAGEKYRWLAELSLQTHERRDGSGYPRGLKGEEIPEFASVVGLADTYVALTMDRPYRKRFSQADAVRLIISEGKTLFPLSILRTFMNEISLYPVGTYVKLNNGLLGQVVSTEKNQPLRPHVKVLDEFPGNKAEKSTVIRLSEQPLLYIKEALSMRGGMLESH